MIIVVFALVWLAPIGAWAVSGSNVFSPSNLLAVVYVYGYTVPACAAPAGASGRTTAPPVLQPDGL